MKEIPPYNIQAEQAVLGEILFASSLSYAKELKPEDFYLSKHQAIFRALQCLLDKDGAVDLIILGNYLKNKEEIENIGGHAYLVELMNQCVSTELIGQHTKIVKEEAIKRQVLVKITETAGKIRSEDLNCILEGLGEFYANLNLMSVPRLSPLSLSEFFGKDIPPVEYIIEGMLQREGRTMISASMNVGKSFFLQNLALAIASGQAKFLDKFEVKKAHVLYLDLEMGESALKQRFLQMCNELKIENLFVKFEAGLDLLDRNDQKALEKWLSELKIDVLIIDPIGDAWSGDENNKQEVGKLTTYLNILKTKFKLSIVISHHWKKKTKDIKRGGEMASGSYKWGAWLDQHITLEGDIKNVTVNCEKSRNASRFKPFIIKLNEETFTFEFLTDFELKFTEQTLVNLFDSFNCERIEIKQLIQRVKEQNICSENTLRKLIKESELFQVDKGGRSHFIYRKEKDSNLFNPKPCQEEASE
ncbi:MAG: AAA family ATPase [Candidatus Omnitrophica bacterium]|nr:AAA family ATPase [Candidatus Omnitrophota bacterium]